MKKFNLIVFSVLVSVLLVSMLSAGITGQVVSFKKGEIKTTYTYNYVRQHKFGNK